MGQGEIIAPYDQVPKTLSEQLTENFYRWEKRGRGWQVYDYSVDLEPPYEPFFHFYIPQKHTYDDGRTPGLFDKVKSWFSVGEQEPSMYLENLYSDLIGEPSPFPFDADAELTCFKITLPKDRIVSFDESERFILSLGRCVQPLSFEIISTSEEILIQFACRESDSPYLHQQIQTFFPDVAVSLEPDRLNALWDQSGNKEQVIIDFGLSKEFMLPLRTFTNFTIDPLASVLGALSGLGQEEIAVFQILFQTVNNPWAESVMRAVLDWEGKSFFADAPQMVPLTKEKLHHPLFAVIIRIGIESFSKDRAWYTGKAALSALGQFSNPLSNELIPLDNEALDEYDHEQDLLFRQSHRTGMLLNTEELTSLVHLPSASVQVAKLKREIKKTKAAPGIITNHELIIGENTHAEKKTIVSLNPDQRIKHTHVIGASGTGKSTLLLNMIIQDMQNGQGVAVLDPHGDLIDQIMGYVPEDRFDDVIIFDPADEEHPIGFNILQSHSEIEKNLLSSDLVALFRRLSTSWGDQMTSVLGNAILAFLESNRGGTLFDLRRFLIESDFRDEFLETVQDPHIIYYWKKEFPLLKYKPQASILTRLDTFLRPKVIRNIVIQKENRLDFAKIMDQRKILLAKLAQGAIGEENSYILGTLLVSAIHKITLSRQQIDQTKRKNFCLYIDEFQNFVTPSMAAVLSGARKYHLGLILAHQELQQLFDKDKNVASAVVSNPYTRICFRLGESDAKRLKDGFSFYDSRDLQNLGIGEAICRIERADYDFNLKTFPLMEVTREDTNRRQATLINLSRERYATKKSDIKILIPELEPKKDTFKPKKKIKPRKAISPEIIDATAKEVTKDIAEPDYEKVKEITKEIRTQGDKLLGRGGPKHKYLQQLIKRFSEEKGYKATIEKELSSGTRVDVALQKNKKKIACQVAITTTESHEIKNIQNCLDAKYDQVILVSTDKRVLKKAETLAAKEISPDNQKRLSFFTLEEFFGYFDSEAPKEETVAGYKVKVRYQPLSESEEKERRQTISKVILDSLRKLKED